MNHINLDKNIEKKGDFVMDACILKPTMPFVTRKKLERTPASDENKKMVEYLDSHNFSFHVDLNNMELNCIVSEKTNNK